MFFEKWAKKTTMIYKDAVFEGGEIGTNAHTPNKADLMLEQIYNYYQTA